MPSPADVADLRNSLDALSGRAQADFARLFRGLDTGDLPALRRSLAIAYPDIIAAYGEMAATVSADIFEVWAYELGMRPKVVPVPSVDRIRAGARMRWATVQPDIYGNLTVILDELVKQPGRSLIQKSATASGGAWARVPSGGACQFCLNLAGRGAVYHTSGSAGEGRKFHGNCGCTTVLVRGPQDYPTGYDPKALSAN